MMSVEPLEETMCHKHPHPSDQEPKNLPRHCIGCSQGLPQGVEGLGGELSGAATERGGGRAAVRGCLREAPGRRWEEICSQGLPQRGVVGELLSGAAT